IHTGDYKTYGEEYYSTEMSELKKKEVSDILNTRMNNFFDIVSKYKKIDKKVFENKIYNGDYVLLNSLSANELKLVDSVKSYNDFLEENNINVDKTVDFEDIKFNINNNKNLIAVLDLEGPISSTDENLNFSINMYDIENKLKLIKKNKNIKALILRVNSPGGVAFDSEMIYKNILKLKEELNIPVYASVSNISASGAYFISLAADKIYASKSSVVGSIGVVSLRPTASKLLDNLKINTTNITMGEYVDLNNIYHKLTEIEKNKITQRLETIYMSFKEKVAKSRNLNLDRVEEIAKGQVYLAEKAKELGLIDKIGGIEKVISDIAKDNDINKYSIIEYNNDMSINDYLSKIGNYTIAPEVKNIREVYSDAYREYIFIKSNANKAMFYEYDLY
ncbi:signal peptide peptidase SppA, partial [Oceanivirga salmonicida]